MYAIVSDIHGNLNALERIAYDMKSYNVEGIILLGDIIDYGMQSNEVIEYIFNHWKDKLICNIWGNHERAIITRDYNRFSSQRGVDSARYTASQLSRFSLDYLNTFLIHEGVCEFELGGRKLLAVHGSLEDYYWKAIAPENVRGEYGLYDIVLSGHSHSPHMFSRQYEINDPEKRNKHTVIFINPGSVGQPRNQNPAAQYALLNINSMDICFRAVEYDVEAAMARFDGSVDDFYRLRLKTGI